MNLFKILVLHGAPKDSHTSIETYLISDSIEKVFKYIDKKFNCGLWKDGIKDGDVRYDSISGEDIPLKDYLMKYCGDLNNEDWSDAYYGITRYGWEDLGPISHEDTKILISLKIATKV